MTICPGVTVTLASNTNNLGSLTVEGTLTFGNSGTTRTLTVSGNVLVNGTVNVSNNTVTHSLVVGGNITNNGTFDLALDANSLCNTTLNGAGPQIIGGTSAGTTEFNAVTVTNSLTINKSGGAVTQTGTLGVGGVLTVQAGTLSLANTTTVTGATSVSGTLNHTTNTGTRTFTGAVTINSGGTWNNTGNEAITFGNNLVNDGTFTSGTATQAFTGGTAQLSGGAAITFSGPVTASGNFVVNKSAGSVTTSNTLTVSGGLTVQAGTLSVANTVAVTGATSVSGTFINTSTTGTKTFTGGVTINSGGTFSNNTVVEPMTIGGNFINDGTFNSGTGTYTFNSAGQWGGANPIAFGGAVSVSANRAVNTTVSVTGTLGITGAVTVTNNSTVTAAGAITGSVAGSTWTNAANSTLNVAGVLLATGTLNASAGSNTVNYNGAVAQSAKQASGGNYFHLTFSGGGTNNLATAASTHNVLGNLTINAGSTLSADTNDNIINVTGNMIVAGTYLASNTAGRTLTIGGNLGLTGTFTGNVAPVTLAGNFTSSGVFTSGAGLFTLNGGSAQMISGTTSPTFTNLTVNSAGVTLSGFDATVSGALTLASGVVTTGANVLAVTGNCPGSVVRTAGHVAGFLRLRIPTGSPTCVFTVGDAAGYRPVTVAFTTVTNTGTRDVTASVTQAAGEHPNIGSSTIEPLLNVNRYWTLVNNTTTFTSAIATFQYLAGDADAGSDQTTFIAGRYASGSWTYPSSSASAGSVQVSGLLTATLAGDHVFGETVSVLFSHWRMNQPAGWNGGANEVTDSGTGGFHGVAASLGTLPTTSSVSPAIAGNPGTCQYGVFNRANKDYVALPAGYPNLMSTAGGFTVTAWINSTNSALPGQRIFIDDQNNASPGGWGFSVGETDRAGAGGLRFYYRQPTVVTVDTVAIPSNQWLFVAVSVSLAAGANASSATLYVYNTAGVQVTTYTQAFTWTAGSDAGPPSIGGETNTAGENTSAFGFSGSIDEVRVYQQALTRGGIELIRSSTSPCVTIDHFSISHTTTGVACDTHTITVTAHDLAHNPVSANGLAVSLSTSNARGTWTGIVAGGGVLSDPVAGDGAATYTFAAGSSSVQLLFRYANLTATSESFNFNVSGGGFSEATGTANITDDPVFTMSQAGFRFRNITDGIDTIPVQISGKPSNTGFNAKTIRIQAIRTDTATGACTGLFASQSRTVELGAECNNPATCAARQVSINGTNISTSNNNAATGAAAYTGVSLAFDAGSEADMVITYPDAGQISVHARYDLDAAVAGYEMTGATNTFVVRPFGITFPGVAHSNTETGTLVTTSPSGGAAGDNFSMTVSAYQWVSGEDANNDGIPDAGVNISNNGTVPNFAATATIASSASLPGTLGSVSRGATCASAATIVLAGGTATASDWCYSEVGNVMLTASVNNYITAGVNITGNSGLDGGGSNGYIGRFRPKRFTVSGASLVNRAVATCTPSSVFTYMDEAMTLAFTLTAQNTQGGTTQNYTGDYAKHDPTVGSNNAKTAFAIGARNVSPFAALTARVAGSYVSAAPTWANGVLNVTGTNAARVTITRPTPDDTPDGPYAQVLFGIAPTDSDGVLMAAYDLDVDNSAGNDHTITASTTAVRYGRMRLGGASGSQLLALGVPLEAQYWNGTFWITNVDDSCTTLTAGNIGFDNYIGNLNAGETTATITASPLQSGRSAIRLSAPGANNNGSVDVALNLGATASANACPALTPAATAGNKGYLRGKWCGATATRDPAARARFGIMRGNDEAIYTRENTN